MPTQSVRVRAAFTAYYDSKATFARNAARAAPNRRHKAGKNTYESRERSLRHLQDTLEKYDVSHIGQITPAHVDEAFESCIDSIVPRIEDVPSPNTIRMVATTFKNFIRWQSLRGSIPANKVAILMENLPSFDAYKRRMLIIPGEDWPDIFKLAHKRHIVDRVMLELAYRLAMRISEALTVRWCDFSDDFSKVQFFRDKRNDTLTLDTPELLKETLREYWQWLIDTGNKPERYHPIVVARIRPKWGMPRGVDSNWPLQRGVQLDANSARLSLRHALLAFGIKPEQMLCQGLHIARRSRACALFRQGVDIRIIAQILGHKKFTTTLDYIRDGLDEAEVKAAMNLPDVPVQDLVPYIQVEHGGFTLNALVRPESKDSVADAMLTLLRSGLLSQDEVKVVMMRVLT